MLTNVLENAELAHGDFFAREGEGSLVRQMVLVHDSSQLSWHALGVAPRSKRLRMNRTTKRSVLPVSTSPADGFVHDFVGSLREGASFAGSDERRAYRSGVQALPGGNGTVAAVRARHRAGEP